MQTGTRARRHSRRYLTVVSLGTCVLCAALSACGEKAPPRREPPPVPVQIAEVIRKDIPVYVEGIGHVAAYYTVDVKSRVTGQLVKTHFKRGDTVRKDQPLFTVDPAPFESKVKEIEAKLQQARVLYEQAKREFLRFRILHSEKAVSLEQLEKKEVEMDSRSHQIEVYKAELETARLDLSYCFIQSPLDGETGETFIDDFNIVNANRDTLVTIKQVRPIKVKFSVPGKFLHEIQKYQNSGPLEVQARPQGSDKPEIGALTLIDNQINPKTGMLALEANFPNQEARLWPGQFVQVQLKLTVNRGAVMAPERAMNEGPEGSYVWVVNEDDTVSIRRVKLERRSGSRDVVSEGLKPGEKVVTEGQLMLQPGARVIVREPKGRATREARSTDPSEGSPESDGKKGAGRP